MQKPAVKKWTFVCYPMMCPGGIFENFLIRLPHMDITTYYLFSKINVQPINRDGEEYGGIIVNNFVELEKRIRDYF